MAFTFTDASNLATAGAQIYSAHKGQKESKASKRAQEAASASRGLAEAAADPTSSRFKNLEALFAEANRRASLEAIDRTMKLSNRARARGDIGFAVNPERRDESRYKALADTFILGKERARDEARRTLLGSAQGVGNVRFPVGAGEAREGSNFDRKITAISSMAPFIEAMSNAFTQRSTTGAPTQIGSTESADPYAPKGTPGGPQGYDRRSTVIY